MIVYIEIYPKSLKVRVNRVPNPFFAEQYLPAFKSIFPGKRWDEQTKSWELPLNTLSQVIAFHQLFGMELVVRDYTDNGWQELSSNSPFKFH